MKTINILRKLEKKPVFNVNNVSRLCYSSKEYSKLILNRLLKKKLIKKVTKNRYTINKNKNIYVIASNLKFPCYISFWSASSYKGYTEQMPDTIQLATTKKYKNIEFEGYKIKFIPIKYFFGYKKQKTEQGDIFIVDSEKLILDCLLKQREVGNFDEIIKVFMNSKISKKKIISYLKKTKNQSLIKRTGFLLDKYKKIDISKEFNLDTNYIRASLFSRTNKNKSSKWRVYYDK